MNDRGWLEGVSSPIGPKVTPREAAEFLIDRAYELWLTQCINMIPRGIWGIRARTRLIHRGDAVYLIRV